MLRGKKETVIEITIAAFLILLALSLRIASLDYIDADDNYEELSYKNLHQNGTSCYKYSMITTKLSLLLVQNLSFKMPVLRIPAILYSIVTIILIYLMIRKVNRVPALISIFLFAVSPWSIVLSRVTRDYAFDCMVASVVLFSIILVITRKPNKDIKAYVSDILIYFSIIILIYSLTVFNHRIQTKIVIVFPVVAILFSLFHIFKKTILNQKVFYSFIFIGSIVFISLFIVSHYSRFMSGILFNKIFFDMFFSTTVESPWHWFHNLSIPGLTYFYFLLFLFPLLYVFRHKKILIGYFLFLYLSFFFALCLFIFKFESHVNYIPTRYVYFLFPVYISLYSFSYYYVVDALSRQKIIKIGVSLIVLIIFLKFLNFGALVYAVYPKKAFIDQKKGTIFIDNIGVGRFDMDEVVEHLKNNLYWSQDQIYVFGTRYAEFLLLLDYEMDNKRCLQIKSDLFYDVGVNMYVESEYWNQHELKHAIKLHKEGYYVTQDKYIKDPSESLYLKLPEKDFLLYGSNFKFIKTINNYKIYSWKLLDNK
jgi:hypothetical protein